MITIQIGKQSLSQNNKWIETNSESANETERKTREDTATKLNQICAILLAVLVGYRTVLKIHYNFTSNSLRMFLFFVFVVRWVCVEAVSHSCKKSVFLYCWPASVLAYNALYVRFQSVYSVSVSMNVCITVYMIGALVWVFKWIFLLLFWCSVCCAILCVAVSERVELCC